MAVRHETGKASGSHAEMGAHEHTRHEGSAGRGWHGNPEGHAEAGRKGGQKVARDREHMSAIGRKGGEAVSRDREHMAAIGRKGGRARGETGAPSARQSR